jgi:regulatory protein
MGEFSDDIWRKAMKSAISLLTMREHSTLELTHKLKHRGYSENLIQHVIAECRRSHYLDDSRAARLLFDSMKRRGYGVQRIRSELHKRGLTGYESELESNEGEFSAEESSVALRVALKKWKCLRHETEPSKRRLRLIRFMRYRGFSERAVLDVLQSIEE